MIKREVKHASLISQPLLFICFAFLFVVLFSGRSIAAGKPGVQTLGVKVGDLAPEFSFQDPGGKWRSLSDYRGKKVFIYSWATWCSCKEQLPDLEKLYKKYKSDKFEIIAVASDSQGTKWVKPYLDKAGATYITLIDPNNELAKKYNFYATGNGFVVDEGGVIRLSSLGIDIRVKAQHDELVKIIQTNFTTPATAAKQKSLDERISALGEDLAKTPGNFQKKLDLAELYRQKSDFAKSEKLLREAIEKKKRSAEAHYRLGVILYNQGKIENAVSEWEKAYKLDSGNYIYMRNIEAYRNPEKFYKEMINKK